MTQAKGVEALVAAHRRMRARMPLVLLGRLVQEALVPDADDVIALGMLPHDAVLAAWRRCAIGVVPSIQPEAFGVVAIEAMAAGVALVASRTGGLADIVVHEQSGLLVPPGDVGALAVTLDRLAGDAELRARLGVGARERAREFTAAAVVPRIEAAYGRAIESRRAALGVLR